MNVLITGAGGQVGQALLAMVPAALKITALARGDLDITDSGAVRRSIEAAAPEVTINAAAYTDVDRAEREAPDAFRVNEAGVAALAAACRAQSSRLVHLSTDCVFDGARSRPWRPHDPPFPQSVYGRSKLAGERAVLAYEGNLVLRTAWVYAATGRNFVTTILRVLAERDEVPVVVDQVGSPTHAGSLAQAIWALVAQGTSGLLHFTDAGTASRHAFAEAIRDEALALGLLDRAATLRPVATADYATAAKRPAYSVLDCSACWALLGGPPRHWRDELRAMLAAGSQRRG